MLPPSGSIGLARIPGGLEGSLGLSTMVPVVALLAAIGLGLGSLPIVELAMGLIGAPEVPGLPFQFDAEDLEGILLL